MKWSILSLGLLLARSAVDAHTIRQTCGDFFNCKGEDICEQIGFGGKHSPLSHCETNQCRLIECCKPPTHCLPQTCGEFYDIVGRNICDFKGYDA
eukprot:Awhi_evm1s12095